MLTSVGAVAQLLISTFSIASTDAYILEPIKDIPIVVFAFLMGAYLARFGLKKALLLGLFLVTVGSFLMASAQTFWAAKILFALIGFSFGLVKIAGYAIIALVETSRPKHMSLMNFMEATFMLGVLASYSIFNYVNSLPKEQIIQWPKVYWFLGGFSAVILILVSKTKIDETKLKLNPNTNNLGSQDFFSTLNLIANPMVIFFIGGVFTFVMLEQGIGMWLPTYNKEILQLSDGFSLSFISIIAWMSVIGRYLASILVRYLNWFTFAKMLLLSAAILMIMTLPLSPNSDVGVVSNWGDAPLAVYIFPLIYMILAPVYPIMSSTILTTLPVQEHSAMTGLIITFSALGGSIGALISTLIFLNIGSQVAFFLYLIPLIMLIILLWKMHQQMLDVNEEDEKWTNL